MGLRIAMISDFFYPRLGGVENHILNLSKELRKLGHTIVVITHSNTGVKGVHYVDGFKTYYLELLSIFGGAVFPTFLCTSVPIGKILLEEKIEVVHGHQSTTLGIEGVFHAKMLGLFTCFTNHSLIKVRTLGGMLTCSAMKMSLVDVDQLICVSQASRENTAERLEIPEKKIKVIPNAVTEEFEPGADRNTETEIVISVVTRLTFRKGAMLLAEILPDLCALDKRIRVVIAGEGDKKEHLEQVVELENLKDRVTFLGGIPADRVKDVMQRSDLFLNTSLTDAFCISIIEAAACGLYVVSTNVDGIGELLPEEMITLTEPAAEELVEGVRGALLKISTYDKKKSHENVKERYRWNRVAKQTEQVYYSICKEQEKPRKTKNITSITKKMLQKRRTAFYLPFMVFFFFNYVIILFLVKKYESRAKQARSRSLAGRT